MPQELRSPRRSRRPSRFGAGAIVLALALAACGRGADAPAPPALAAAPSEPPTPKPFVAPPQPNFPSPPEGSPGPVPSPSNNCVIGPNADEFGLPSARQAPAGPGQASAPQPISPFANPSPSGAPGGDICPTVPFAADLLGFWQLQPVAEPGRNVGLGAGGVVNATLGVLRVDADGTYQWLIAGRVGRVGKLERYTPRSGPPELVAYKVNNGTEDLILLAKDGGVQLYSLATERLMGTGQRTDASVDKTNLQGMPIPAASQAPLGGPMQVPFGGGGGAGTGMPGSGVPPMGGMGGAKMPIGGFPMSSAPRPPVAAGGIGGFPTSPASLPGAAGGGIGGFPPAPAPQPGAMGGGLGGFPPAPAPQPGAAGGGLGGLPPAPAPQPGAAGGATGGTPPAGGPLVAVSAPPPLLPAGPPSSVPIMMGH